MSTLHNPLFDNEKEFLERQKLEYERALLGDVDHIKEQARQAGKYAAIGAGVLGGIWLISKVFGGSDSGKKEHRQLKAADKKAAKSLQASARRPLPSTNVDTAVADDLGFGSRRLRASMPGAEQATKTPDSDPFQPATDYNAVGQSQSLMPQVKPVKKPHKQKKAWPNQETHEQQEPPQSGHGLDAAAIVASTFNAFMKSDTGKMLVAQATAVTLAFVAKKAGDYLPILKNTDLAQPNAPRQEPETRDIEFTYHHDDADAPTQPA